MSRVPIRIRLSIWYALLLAAALLLFGIALYFGLRHLLYEDFQDRVYAEAALAAALVQPGPNGPTVDEDALERWEDDDNLFRLFSPSGELVIESDSDLDDVQLDRSAFEDALDGDESYRIDTSEQPAGLVTGPVESGDQIIGIIQVGKSRTDVDEMLRLLLTIMTIAAPIAIAVAVAGGYFLSGRALEPVDEITSLAASIDANDLQRRIDLDLPNDEIGRLAATFNGMLARIDGAFARQRRFTGDAAHELRTPLATLQSEVEVALSSASDADEYRVALTEVQTDLARLSGIVRGLLVLARSDAASLHLERETFDLQTAIQSLIEQYREPALDMDVILIDESNRSLISADQDLVVQLLVNLIDNALAYSRAGDSVRIGNRLVNHDVHIWLADTGPGIPPEHIEKVFEPFYRADPGRSRAKGGVGLGLSICKAIVEAHGGRIWLSNGTDTGLRVEAVFPAVQ